jgi:hypothetical protein
MPRNDVFFIEEYKSLRQEIGTKLKDRLEFSRWGLIGLAALYSYIFSNPGKPVLFWIPVWLSLVMIGHLNEEHRLVHKAGDYIRDQLEPWAKSGHGIPKGWEKYWACNDNPAPWWVFWRRWPREIWDWSPVPLWVSVLALTLYIAIGASAGRWPSLIAPPVSCSS